MNLVPAYDRQHHLQSYGVSAAFCCRSDLLDRPGAKGLAAFCCEGVIPAHAVRASEGLMSVAVGGILAECGT